MEQWLCISFQTQICRPVGSQAPLVLAWFGRPPASPANAGVGDALSDSVSEVDPGQ